MDTITCGQEKKKQQRAVRNERSQSLNSINNNVPFYDDEQFIQKKCAPTQSNTRNAAIQFNKTATRLKKEREKNGRFSSAKLFVSVLRVSSRGEKRNEKKQISATS